MPSRKPEDLHPDLLPLYRKFESAAAANGIDYLLTCTYRSNEEQDRLYAQGRTTSGSIVTRARAGQSAHNFTIEGKPASKAFDVVPMEHGKPCWDDKHPAWQELGAIGQRIGLKWYGAPDAKFREFPHFEMV